MNVIIDPYTGREIEFGEDLNSQTFAFAQNVFALRRGFLTDWPDRIALSRAFLGNAVVGGKNSTLPYLLRASPVGFADLTDFRPEGQRRPVLYATQVESIEPRGPTKAQIPSLVAGNPGAPVPEIQGGRYNDPGLYKKALVRFLFEAPTYNILRDNETPTINLRVKSVPSTHTHNPSLTTTSWLAEYKRFTTRITQPMTEALRIPLGYWNYVEGFWENGKVKAKPGQPVDIGTYVLYPKLEVQYHWHRVPGLVQGWETGVEWLYQDRDGEVALPGTRPELPGACYTHLGCVNARFFDGFAPGTLLLTSIEARPYKWIGGERYFDIVYRMVHFNPVETFVSNSFPFINTGVPPGPTETRPATTPFPFAGHNYLLRLVPPEKDPNGTIRYTLPYFSLVTNDGRTLEQGGRPVFSYRDFEDLFVPYNRAHMVRYYAKTTLCPNFNEAGT